MLKHYSHIRMEAKRKALETIATKKTAATSDPLKLKSQMSTSESPQVSHLN
jgi:hypothetical protein